MAVKMVLGVWMGMGVMERTKRISILISRRMRLLVRTTIVGIVGMGARVGLGVLLALVAGGRCPLDDEDL